MSSRLHHIHLIIRDLQKMIDFYTEHFGATLIAMRKFGPVDGATLDLDGITINLRLPQETEELRDGASGKIFGYHHIGIIVDDIDAKYKELTEKGYIFSAPPKDVEKLRIAFFDGPENTTIELLQTKG